ncbi:helix-turn-helix transcriptional regulator [Stenotrophomonas maltophilia]|uniref:Helix-turn-helix transcriptional regulator n=1 Tax=Stenotrophomonas maltophilia TaxID=40324 RepID=A0AAI9BY53_STEMA|nr:helix-turn-helix transcriptional regulator [Stenotrophomonas maltophilia]
MDTTLSERLVAARERAGISQTALARTVGISQQAIAQLESGKAKKTGALAEIARALNVDPMWLALGEGDMDGSAEQSNRVDDSEYTDVIGYSQAVGLGSGAEAQEYAETHSLKFKKTSLRRRGILGHPLAVYYGKGDSMEPTIKDGDAILFDTSDTRVKDGELYVIRVDGIGNPEFFVKRAFVIDAGTYFQSDNPQGDHTWRKPKPMDSRREPISVIGRVHWIGGWSGG